MSLLDAIRDGQDELVAGLLCECTDINFQDEIDGMTALHWAARRGDIKLCKLLIKHGADVNLKSQVGTPEEIALVYHHKKTATWLKRYAESGTLRRKSIGSKSLSFRKSFSMKIFGSAPDLTADENDSSLVSSNPEFRL